MMASARGEVQRALRQAAATEECRRLVRIGISDGVIEPSKHDTSRPWTSQEVQNVKYKITGHGRVTAGAALI
jgi:hypothetical protein